MPSTSPSLYLVRSGPLLRFWGLFRQALRPPLMKTTVSALRKGAAYSSLLAFFPVLASITAILAQVKAYAVAGVFSRFSSKLCRQAPGSGAISIHDQRTKPGWLILAGTILSAWAASGAIMSLLEGFQAAYRLPSGRPFVKQRAWLCCWYLLRPFRPLDLRRSSFSAPAVREQCWRTGCLPVNELKIWAILLGSFLRYAMALGATVLVTALLL